MNAISAFWAGALAGVVFTLFFIGYVMKGSIRERGVNAGIAHYSTTTGDFHWDSTVVRGDTVFVTRRGK